MSDANDSSSTSSPAALTLRVRELEAENAALAEIVHPSQALAAGRRWRGMVSALCIVLAAILTPLAMVGTWAGTHLLNENIFLATLAPIADSSEVQQLLIDETMSAVHTQVDFTELTNTVFDGIIDLGMDPAAASALGLLRQPAADALASLVESSVANVVESHVFSDVWANSLRGAHRTLTAAATSDGGGIVVFEGSDVGIAIDPIVESIKATLAKRGVPAASLIPAIDRTIILGDGQSLITLRAAYPLLPVVTWGLPAAVIVLFVLGIVAARRRSVGVVGTGVGIAAGSAVLSVGLAVGAVAMVAAAGDLGLSPAALDTIYVQLVSSLRHTAQVFTVVGIGMAIVGWGAGSSRPARSARTAVRSGTASARAFLARRGFNTGSFGRWLAKYRVTVRIAIAALGALLLFWLGPVSIGTLCLVIVTTLLVGWLLETLQQRESDT